MRTLSHIEWHDLPITNFSIGEKGITLEVASYDEVTGKYASFTLALFDFGQLKVSMDSELSLSALAELEVYGFDYQHVGERLSGKLSILTGPKGFWSIEFTNAEWSMASPLNQWLSI